MNEPKNSLFESFVEDCGGRQQTAEKLNCSYQLVCHILTGERGISKDVAESVERISGGKYCKSALIWGK
jgi:hypothetical protein